MSWRLDFRPRSGKTWQLPQSGIETHEAGLGLEFVGEIIKVFDAIAEHPLLGSRRHAELDVRWRYPKRFPYRVIYRVDEQNQTLLVVAILHAARRDSRWRARML